MLEAMGRHNHKTPFYLSLSVFKCIIYIGNYMKLKNSYTPSKICRPMEYIPHDYIFINSFAKKYQYSLTRKQSIMSNRNYGINNLSICVISEMNTTICKYKLSSRLRRSITWPSAIVFQFFFVRALRELLRA